MLKNKTVVLGVTGSIAAYKIAGLASMLVKQRCNVHVIMTRNATQFINPVTFETLTGNKCLVDTFDRNFQFHVAHVSLAQEADVMMIAPASANMIGKLAHGIADDMLSTTALACTSPIIVSPAMNTHMYENPAVQENLETLRRYGMTVIDPASGRLACGDSGAGKMPEPQTLMEYILREIACEKDLKGVRVMVTAGPTREAIDPVRFITNRSTGKMGYALARRAMLRGAEVTLVSGPVALEPVPFVDTVPVISARDMFEAVRDRMPSHDILIKAAAVADYRPDHVSEEKIKKKDSDMIISLERTTDIIGHIGENRRPDQVICGFSMETQNMLENSRRKLSAKKMDMIVANNLKEKGAGFGTDTNRVTIITEKKDETLKLMSKECVADVILDRAGGLLKERRQSPEGSPKIREERS